MKTKWEVKKLGDVCEIELGKTPYRGDKSFWDPEKQSNNVWLSIADLLNGQGKFVFDSKEYISNKGAQLSKIVKKGTLLVSFKLTLGRLAFAGRDLFTNEAIAALTIKNEKTLFNEYLYYFFTFFDWHAETKGDIKVKGKTLNKAKLKEIKVILPSLPIQKQIVAILDKTFEKLSKAKENAEQNLKNAREVFESYLQSVFENKGEGWEEKKLCQISEIKPPKKEAKDKLDENELVSFAPMADLGINQKFLLPNKERTLKEVQGSYTYFTDQNVLLAKITPCFENGKLSIAKNLKNGIGFGSSEYIVFRTGEDVESEFLYYFLLRQSFREEGAKRMMGAVGHKRISKNFIENYPISFPDKFIQKQIILKLDALSQKTKKLEQIHTKKLKNLKELKKSILQKAFAGELIC